MRRGIKYLAWPILLGAITGASADQDRIRVATFNASLTRPSAGALRQALGGSAQPQIAAVAAVIKEIEPDILLINEFDRDATAPDRAVALFQKNYLAPLRYPYHWCAEVNTGVASGEDLDQDGVVGGAGDAWGFGAFPGQYGMLVLSKFPIAEEQVRSFQHFLWKDMPGNRIPRDWYAAEQQNRLRLSSKSHWDLPLKIHGRTLHLLASHPTPPVFDGEEDRNGRRNHDEIRFWIDYLSPGKSDYLYDDRGTKGGLPANALFILCGDLNADPNDGDSTGQPIRKLLACPRIQPTPVPISAGGAKAAKSQGLANRNHRGDPAQDTGDFDDETPGNLRVDYVLPCRELRVANAVVHWPLKTNEPAPSDHRLVYMDIYFR